MTDREFTGKYLTEAEHEEGFYVWKIAIQRARKQPRLQEWAGAVKGQMSLEETEQFFMTALRQIDERGLPMVVPFKKVEGRSISLTFGAVLDLSEAALGDVCWISLHSIAGRLVWEEDEELLPPELAKKFLAPWRNVLPPAPPTFTLSFATAAELFLEKVPPPWEKAVRKARKYRRRKGR
jgi:hypothetical protein